MGFIFIPYPGSVEQALSESAHAAVNINKPYL